ncbi:Hypothetical protein, putative [Bodo saltans]|uniref:Uncharacterized protein n=1 Tax=Bodo saltans TaxID=75058 RepID=A0A0S4JVV9_BODSA|nr:Hypothetical protein, putative [Bodo saltans]|eukprot:CUG94337.1 Hypothetical protein, putative [Bodo saltans]
MQNLVYLEAQLAAQAAMRCDYVLLHYEKCADGVPGVAPPQYAVVGKGVPVKLAHQVFIQISFRILRDRIVGLRRQQSVERAGGSRLSASTSRERDCVALFLFLRAYLMQMRQVAAVVEGRSDHSEQLRLKQPATSSRGGGRGGSGGAGAGAVVQSRPKPAESSSTKLPSSQHLRFQLLLEYGIDVQPLLDKHNSQDIKNYCLETCMPSEATEEEFLLQMSSPSEMAQTCSIM